ncbi:MAG TPA: hypothetical protein PLU43_11150, partial [Lachnospiraceae bacterium]|nr:hypothetical protein [Lachnospiraceae bacterium]
MKNRMRNGCMVVLFGLLFVLIGCSMGAQDAQLDFGKNQVSEKTVAVSAVNASEEEIPDGLTSELYD